MGYTHYFRTNQSVPLDKWTKLTVAVKKLMAGQDMLQWECDIAKPPAVTHEMIRFNGIEGDGYETFLLPRESKPASYDNDKSGFCFNCCKTAYQPYDKYVTAVLFLAKIHLGKDINISSDGDVSEWQDGIALVNEKLGKDYSMKNDPNYADEHQGIKTAIISNGELKINA